MVNLKSLMKNVRTLNVSCYHISHIGNSFQNYEKECTKLLNKSENHYLFNIIMP